MILSHFSAEPFIFDKDYKYSRGYPYSENDQFFKPLGLWLSDESSDGWKRWCTDEEFNLDGIIHETKFDLDMNGILHLSNNEEIRSFQENFKDHTSKMDHIFPIDWKLVQSSFNGIVISPYPFDLRI